MCVGATVIEWVDQFNTVRRHGVPYPCVDDRSGDNIAAVTLSHKEVVLAVRGLRYSTRVESSGRAINLHRRNIPGDKYRRASGTCAAQSYR